MYWKQKTLLERIRDRWSEKDSQYSKVNRNRDVITTYFRSDEILEVNDKGEFVGQEIYNASGSWYSRMMATGFQGSLVSKNISWIRYQMEQYELQGIDELDRWCQDIKEYMTDVYNRSSFYDVQPQFTLEGLTTGSPIMFGEEDMSTGKTMWMPQHYKSVRLYYDKYNRIEGLIVKDEHWTVKHIYDTFIKRDDENGTKRKAKLPLFINNALESGQLDSEYTCYRAVFKSNDPIWDGEWKKPIGYWGWYSVYFLDNTEKEKSNTPLNEDTGYFSQPFVVWDFDKKPWEVASRTPAWYAVWDCMGHQQIFKNFQENVQLKNRPTRIATDTMRGRLQLGPEGEIYVSEREYDRPPKALDLIGDVNLNKELSDIYEDTLKRWFYIDRFQMFSDLVKNNPQPPSATQIWQMAGEKSTLLSPAIETHSRYLESSDARMVSIEWAAGRGPFDRATLENITDIVMGNAKGIIRGIGIAPVFIGALAQAQKRNQAMEPIQSGVAAATGLFQLFPDLRVALREYDTLDDILRAVDFPQKNIRPKEDYEKIIESINQQRREDAQFAKSLALAKASKDVSGKVEPDSVLGAMANAGQKS